MNKYIILLVRLVIALFVVANMVSCAAPEIAPVVIYTPDKYSHVYEANEKIILRAIASVFRDKSIGSNILINWEKKQVETDYIISGDWRIKSIAQVRKINWKESEVTLSVVTERKTEEGWRMSRLLDKEQYDNFFSVIEIAIYEEMARIE